VATPTLITHLSILGHRLHDPLDIDIFTAGIKPMVEKQAVLIMLHTFTYARFHMHGGDSRNGAWCMDVVQCDGKW
jgi:hypothetical protein